MTKEGRGKKGALEPSEAPVRVPIDTLKGDPENARKRNARGKNAIESSVRKFGAARSVVLDGDGVVRAGNGTVEAARKAGIRDVLVVETDAKTLVAVKRKDWSDAEAKAYGLADNRTTDLSEFDPEALAASLDELVAEGFDVGVLDIERPAQREPLTAEDLKEWDASDLTLDALFTFRAPIELQPKIRALLKKNFPGVKFEEDTVYG